MAVTPAEENILMAAKKHSTSYSRGHARVQKRNTLWQKAGAAFLAFLIVLGALFGGLELWGKGNVKPSNWGKKDPAEEPPATEQDTSGGLEIEEPDAEADAGIQLTTTVIPRKLYAQYNVMPIAETAMQVTATVTPAEAQDKLLEWHLAWQEPTNGWATGKEASEYVTLSVSKNTLTATLSCLQAFGEPLELTASIKDNSAVKSTPRMVHYRQRYEGLTVSGTCNFGSESWEFRETTDVTLDFPETWTNYDTLIQHLAESKVEGTTVVTPKLSSIYTKEANSVQGTAIYTLPSEQLRAKIPGYTDRGGYINSFAGLQVNDKDAQGNVFNPTFAMLLHLVQWKNNAETFYAWKRAMSELSPETALYTVKIELHIQGGKTFEKTYSLRFNKASFGTFGDAIDTGTGEIIFE